MKRLRRAVLALLLVVGVATTAYGFVATRPADEQLAQEESAPTDVVTATCDPVVLRREGDDPIRVVGRRGDPVNEPENTAESFAAALQAGVTLVETEVVMTQDAELVLRSSNELSRTTDVADHPEFADRGELKTIDGTSVDGWYTEDFSLDELRNLRAIEPEADRRPESASHDGEYAVIGFEDLLDQLLEHQEETGECVGLIVRPVRPTYFRNEGLPIEPAIVAALRDKGFQFDPGRVTVESSDLTVLDRIENSLGDNVLSSYVIAADDSDELDADRLDELPDTIDAVAVEVGAFSAFSGREACVVGDRAHDAGLALMVFPVSYENALLGNFRTDTDEDPDPGARGNLTGLLRGLRDLGTDAILAESPTDVIEGLDDLAANPKLRTSLCE